MKKKKNMKIFLPGFHTGTDWKIALASIFYIVVVLLAMMRGLQKGIILFAALIGAVYLAYGIAGLFAKEKKPVMSAVYILAALVVIAGDSVLMNAAGLSVADVMKSSPDIKYSSSSSSKAGGAGSSSAKQNSSSKQTSSKQASSKQTGQGGAANNADNADVGGANGNINQMTDTDILNIEEKIDDSLNEDVFSGDENKANAVQLYYVEKRSLIYHKSSDCSSLANKKVYTVTSEEVQRRVMIPCGKCAAE